MSKPANTVKIQSSRPWQYQKGVSGNPKGKPRDTRHFKTIMRDYVMNLKDDKGVGLDQRLVEALFKKALNGNTRAMEIIFDRVDGKVQDHAYWDDEKETGGLSEEDKKKLLRLMDASKTNQREQ